MSLIELFDVSEISSGEMRKAELPCGKTVAVYNVDGEIFATADLCTHEDVSLCEDGSLLGGVVECGWHYGTFDVKTGKALTYPCEVDLEIYPVRIIDHRVVLEV
ncbi:MAG: nitrite reductase/ring-hydroxylating ferredoxin subunit [Zhongshania marina]|jgi:p-cumate 2,3-dioxygenase ferredoxin subunit